MSKKLKKNVSEIRFSEFSGDLELKYLGEILDFKNGINADKSSYGQGIKFINVLDIINKDPIHYDSIIGCVAITDQEFQKNNVQYGDVLFQRSSEIREEAGQSNIYLDKNRDATFGGFVIRGRPKVKFNPIYFNYLLKTSFVRKEITDRSGGSTRFNVGQDSLSQIPILICNSLAEQEKIASFLGAIDTRLTQLRRKRELLQTYKRGVMQKIFSQEIRFKGAIGSEFPEWERATLKEIDIEISDGNYGELYPNQSDFKLEGIPFIRANNLKNGKITWNDMRFIDSSLHKALKSGHLLNKDILISTRGDIGTVALVKEEFQGANINAQLCLLRNPKACNTIFLFYFLLSENAKKQFLELTTGSALKQLPRKNLLNLTVDFPSLEEQEKIADFLTAIDRKIEAVSQQIDRTEQFKKGLLQKMFV